VEVFEIPQPPCVHAEVEEGAGPVVVAVRPGRAVVRDRGAVAAGPLELAAVDGLGTGRRRQGERQTEGGGAGQGAEEEVPDGCLCVRGGPERAGPGDGMEHFALLIEHSALPARPGAAAGGFGEKSTPPRSGCSPGSDGNGRGPAS